MITLTSAGSISRLAASESSPAPDKHSSIFSRVTPTLPSMAEVASSSNSHTRHQRSNSHASTSGLRSPTTPTTTASGHRLSNTHSNRARGTLGTAGRPLHHRQALSAIRAFLRRESCFDILPESFRLIVFDNKLLIKRALVALQTNGTWMSRIYSSKKPSHPR